MIGFAVKVTVYDGDADPEQRMALLSLDTDADEPVLDVRWAGDDTAILTCDVGDAWAAVVEVSHQLERRRRENPFTSRETS